MIELASGRMFDTADCYITIEEMAASLSKQCRFTGSCRHFYSVAEHSIIVSLLMEDMGLGDPVEGLLHDGIETAVGDLASPWKPVIGWRGFEHPMDAKLRAHYDLTPAKTKGCDYADQLAGYIEARLLMPSRGELWSDADMKLEADRLIADGWRTLNLYPPEAEAAFLKRWEALNGKDRIH